MAVVVTAELTNEGRRRFADMSVPSINRAFIIEEFEIGEGGHDPEDLTQALRPDVSVTDLPLKTFGPKAITSSNKPTDFIAEYVLDLTANEAVGIISNIGLIARISSSGIPSDPEINTKFLFAVANLPIRNKLAGETLTLQVRINY